MMQAAQALLRTGRRPAVRLVVSALGGRADDALLASLESPLILDVRDPHEVARGKGGPPARIAGSQNVPLNIDGARQSARATTAEEFLAKVAAAGVDLPADRPIVTHCGGGGRAARAARLLRDLGYDAHNGGSPANVAAALAIAGATYP